MKTPSLKTLLCASALLGSLGAISHLSAQVFSTTPANITTTFPALGTVLRTYTGTVIQTSAAGAKTNGTVTVDFYSGARVHHGTGGNH